MPAEVLSAAHAPGERTQDTGLGAASDTLPPAFLVWHISVKPRSQSGRAEDGLKHLLFSMQATRSPPGGTPWTQAGEKDQPGLGWGRGLARCWSWAARGSHGQVPAWSLPLLPCAQTGPWGGRGRSTAPGKVSLQTPGWDCSVWCSRLGRQAGGRSAV